MFFLVSTVLSLLASRHPTERKNNEAENRNAPRPLRVVSCSSKNKYDTRTSSRIGWGQAWYTCSRSRLYDIHSIRPSMFYNSQLCFETTCDIQKLAYKLCVNQTTYFEVWVSVNIFVGWSTERQSLPSFLKMTVIP